jgi:hypothetical protein
MRGLALSAAVVIIATWSALQFWLAHRGFAFMDAQAHARTALWYSEHPGMHLTVTYVPSSYWVDAGIESVVALLLVLAVAVALAVGGRRWWTLLVAALPATVAVGRFEDGTSIGQGWQQPTNALQTWFGVGVAVDTVTLLLLATLIVLALPRFGVRGSAGSTATTRSTSAVSALFRAAPAAVILVGWWLARHPIADPVDRLWIAQAVVWVVLVALVASSSLPSVARLGVVVVVMPLLSFTVIADFVGGIGHPFDGTRYLHHLATAAGIAAYVVGVPALQGWAQRRSAGPTGNPRLTTT